MEDITRQQELQKQLLHSQKLESIGSLAGGVAHDFNNLLMVISGYAEDVHSEVEREDLKESLNQVLWAGKKARELTHKLLAFSRQQVAETKPVSLSEVVKGLLKLFSRTIGEDIEVVERFSVLPLTIRGNVSQVEQVLVNLIINARDAMPHGGVLTTETGWVEGSEAAAVGDASQYAFVRITDTGTGIRREHLDKIFDPYFTTKETGKGTGLGLAIAYGVVRQHQGRITVDSTEGKGTAFTVYFPLHHPCAGESVRVDAGALPAGTETVLVVEDDDTVRNFVSFTLTRAGFKVMAAADGFEALEIAAVHPLDILFSDVIMPKMNGLEMYARMKEIHPNLKVVFASGYSADVVSGKGIDQTDYRFVQKPVPRETLLRTVREALDGTQCASP